MNEAFLNGLPIECETIQDGFKKSLAKHEFPYRDDTLLEDMGQQARTVRIRCYFYNDTYEDHGRLLELLKNRQAFELEHPKYGLLSGSVETVSVRHDDRERTAEIDFEFVTGDIGPVAPIALNDVRSGVETFYTDGLDSAQDTLVTNMHETLGADAEAVLDQELDPDTDILTQYPGIAAEARAYVKKVDEVLRTVEDTLSDVATPAGALISTLDFAANLPGRVIGAVARVAARYSAFLTTLQDAPDRFMQSMQDGLTTLENALFGSFSESDKAAAHLNTAFNSVVALEAGLQAAYAFDDDENRRQVQKRLEGVKSFDAAGKYTAPEPVEAVMNVREIEQALYTVRAMIQLAVDSDRENDSLKQMARALLTHVNEIKLEREKIMTVLLDNVLPLHLVCLKHGLSYRAAERIMAINAIPNPNFASGSIDIYAR